ncbi:hypothetical protein KO528_17455 [Saccharophagus degradans]|uniref:Uncharacterized protein n=1 Tax=Saccharophagus degradans TaxID=86304 RepID=A0AAW7X1W6_9GAMM|nr:hypothetical protein [Saccharophagus degradans]MBU2987157.1 hypothetical protein [Saccharophagus degradans]MDO6421740.1 hypothetical protein [Saccharophagus degradans]MDO6606566.1 hypothetical protein [Saccharophagus degradans]
MKAEIILDWDYQPPELDGIYFVAIQYGEGAGMLEFMEFKDGQWSQHNGGEIVAHIDIGKLNNQLSIRWPDAPKAPQAFIEDEFREA